MVEAPCIAVPAFGTFLARCLLVVAAQYVTAECTAVAELVAALGALFATGCWEQDEG